MTRVIGGKCRRLHGWITITIRGFTEITNCRKRNGGSRIIVVLNDENINWRNVRERS